MNSEINRCPVCGHKDYLFSDYQEESNKDNTLVISKTCSICKTEILQRFNLVKNQILHRGSIQGLE